jgi:DivIVA domain-containing protein
MSFPLNAIDIPGYSTGQVDALMARVKSQYQNPDRRLITSAMLAVVKFDLTPGGYQIAEVDDALARVADTFDQREIQRRIQLEGKAAIAGELSTMLKLIRPFLELKAAQSFNPARNGYNRKLVSGLLKRISVKRGEVIAPESQELRTMNLGRSSSGLDRHQIDEFLALLIAAIHRQRALR